MCFCLKLFALPFKSKIRLDADDAILRHQLIVLQKIRELVEQRLGVLAEYLGPLIKSLHLSV
jgi:hypothetical protein